MVTFKQLRLAYSCSNQLFIWDNYPSQAIADVIRTCLGPRAMLKMLMDPMGGIVMTNDGNAILREVSLNYRWY